MLHIGYEFDSSVMSAFSIRILIGPDIFCIGNAGLDRIFVGEVSGNHEEIGTGLKFNWNWTQVVSSHFTTLTWRGRSERREYEASARISGAAIDQVVLHAGYHSCKVRNVKCTSRSMLSAFVMD
jgi:hypothetical protein